MNSYKEKSGKAVAPNDIKIVSHNDFFKEQSVKTKKMYSDYHNFFKPQRTKLKEK